MRGANLPAPLTSPPVTARSMSPAAVSAAASVAASGAKSLQEEPMASSVSS